MNRPLLILLVIASTGLAALCVYQQWELSDRQTQIARITREAVDEKEKAAGLEARTAALRKEKAALAAESAALRTRNAELQSSATADAAPVEASPSPEPAKTGGFMGELNKMMKDPAFKAMMAKQQRALIEQYAPGLIRQLGLSPEEGRALVDLIAQRQTAALDRQSAVSDGQPPASPAPDPDAAVKSFLGDARYKQYQDYEKSLPSRMMVDQLKQQLSSTSYPLLDFQNQQLVQITQEETQAAGAPPAITDPNQMNGDMMNDLISRQEQINSRVLARAQSILSPDQYKAYQTYLENAVSVQKLSAIMMQKMAK